jgi:predicted DNA-binding transcriptional regulator AlpA
MARNLIAAGDLPARKGISLSERQRKRLEDKGLFPKRVQISERTHAYVEQEVDAHVEARINERDNNNVA